MAKDDNTNDKDQDDFFGDDEDFGLPELDYEALDDDDESAVEEKVEEPAAEETPVEETKEEEVTAEDDSIFDDESMDDIPDQISDEELEASLEDDSLEDTFSDEDISMDDAFADADDEMEDSFGDTFEETTTSSEETAAEEPKEEAADDFYEEESFDDFGASGDDLDMGDDGDEEIPDSVFDSDVLDEDEFAQFEKELMDSEEEEIGDVDSYESSYSEESAPTENKGKFARIVIIGILIFAGLGAAFIGIPKLLGDGEENSTPVAEKTTPKPAATKTPEEKPQEQPAEQPAQEDNSSTANGQPSANSGDNSNTQANSRPANTPVQTRPTTSNGTPGTVNALSERTGNFYIVVASFLDGDMALDHANELSSAGKSPSIIPPFGNAVTHRVAIAGYGTLAESQRAVDSFKAEYGEDIWILKY